MGSFDTMASPAADELVRLGREALAAADWERARALFEQAAELGETAEVWTAWRGAPIRWSA